MSDEKRIRTFLALDLPPHIRQKIAGIQTRLKQSLSGDIRWTHPDSVHLTLKFFGSISHPQIAAITNVVSGITARTARLALKAGKLGAFPGTKRPRVIWLGLAGDTEPLARLQMEIDEKLLACGFGTEGRPFRPHLTLGRLRAPGTISGFDAIIAEGNETTAGGFSASELTLFKSEPTPRGSIYTPLAIYPFATLK